MDIEHHRNEQIETQILFENNISPYRSKPSSVACSSSLRCYIETFQQCFQLIRFMIDCFSVQKSEQKFVRLKKRNFLQNIATKTLQDQTISTIFCYEQIEKSIKILKIVSQTKSENHFESVGLGKSSIVCEYVFVSDL